MIKKLILLTLILSSFSSQAFHCALGTLTPSENLNEKRNLIDVAIQVDYMDEQRLQITLTDYLYFNDELFEVSLVQATSERISNIKMGSYINSNLDKKVSVSSQDDRVTLKINQLTFTCE